MVGVRGWLSPSLVPLIHPPEVGSSDLPDASKTPVNLPTKMEGSISCTEKDTGLDDTKEMIQRNDDAIQQGISPCWGQLGNS